MEDKVSKRPKAVSAQTSAVETFEEKPFQNEHRSSKYLNWIYKVDNLGVETRGIERVPPEERVQYASERKHSKTRQIIAVMGLWFSVCGGLTSMSSFFLPTLVFGLNLKDSITSGIVAMVIGCLVPAYCATMAPESGSRQMVSAKFVFGKWGVKLVGILGFLGLGGWSVTNCVMGGGMLSAMSSHIGLEVGIVIISVVSLVVAVFGIKALMRFQGLYAIPAWIANILFYIVVMKKKSYLTESNQMVADLGYDSATVRGNWLSFFTIGFSVTATWGGCASDYYIMFAEDTPSWEIFAITFFGICVPTTFVAVLGTYLNSITLAYQPWNDVYNEHGVGALIYETFTPWGRFGEFVVAVLYISLICNNILNTYSIAFDVQIIDRRLQMIPRWCYAILTTVVVMILALVGKDSFSTILSNFLPMLGYWISIYASVLIEENLIFRNGYFLKFHYKEFKDTKEGAKRNYVFWPYKYNWDAADDSSAVTHGFAAMLSFCIGAVGPILGMNQVYWQGPIARKLGSHGGDVGFFLAFAFTLLAYPPLRYLELKRLGK